MKKLLITLVLAVIATVAVWAVSFRKDDLSRYIPQEQPAAMQSKKQLLLLQEALTGMCIKSEWKKLEKCFSISKADRSFIKQETGEDPVEKYISLLKDYASLMRNAEWEMTQLVNNHNSFVFRIPGENGKKLCISLMKQKGHYLLTSVEEKETHKKK